MKICVLHGWAVCACDVLCGRLSSFYVVSCLLWYEEMHETHESIVCVGWPCVCMVVAVWCVEVGN